MHYQQLQLQQLNLYSSKHNIVIPLMQSHLQKNLFVHVRKIRKLYVTLKIYIIKLDEWKGYFTAALFGSKCLPILL